MKGSITIGLMASIMLLSVFTLQRTGVSEVTDAMEVALGEALARPVLKGLKVFNGTIMSVMNATIIIESKEFNGGLIAKGGVVLSG